MAGISQDYWQNYVDGAVDGGAGRLTVENPGTGETLAEIAWPMPATLTGR